MTQNEKMIELKKLLDSKGWKLVLDAWKERRRYLAREMFFRESKMFTVDKDLTPADLIVNRIMELSYCIDSLPKKMVENPNYDPTKDVDNELTTEEINGIIEDMFKQKEA